MYARLPVPMTDRGRVGVYGGVQVVASHVDTQLFGSQTTGQRTNERDRFSRENASSYESPGTMVVARMKISPSIKKG